MSGAAKEVIPAANPPTPGQADRRAIRNDHFDIAVLPGKGADIYSIIDRATGVDVLFKTPWGWHNPATLVPTGDSQRDWLAVYPGGWQQLIPNAGPERVRGGVRRGYHGEAAIVPWQVYAHARNAIRLTTQLSTVPLELNRTLILDGPTLHIRDTITNEGPDPLEVMWVQHPSFGAPFVDAHTRLEFDAATFVSDAEAPGTALAADTTYDLATRSTDAAGGGVGTDLRTAPERHSGRSVFGCLTDFASGRFTIASPTAGFGIRLDWDTAVYPHAWFWQECHASPGYPWFRRAYVIAIEPANIIPGEPSLRRADRGVTPVLPPGAQWISELSFTRVPLA